MPKQAAAAVIVLVIIAAVLLLGYFGLPSPMNLFGR